VPTDTERLGERSRRVLAEVQQRVLAGDRRTVVLVEGLSDCFALETAARRTGIDLRHEGVDVLPMGGATNLPRFLTTFGPTGRAARLAGLCDRGEEGVFARCLERAGLADRVDRAVMESLGFFVCERDLEDELIRALGPARVEEVIEGEGELDSLRRLQQMPQHRGRAPSAHLHRFIGVRAGRKHRYAPLLVEALDEGALPRPIAALLTRLVSSHAARAR
jgi:hypothetical protein